MGRSSRYRKQNGYEFKTLKQAVEWRARTLDVLSRFIGLGKTDRRKARQNGALAEKIRNHRLQC
jgi:hypothetical protein